MGVYLFGHSQRRAPVNSSSKIRAKTNLMKEAK